MTILCLLSVSSCERQIEGSLLEISVKTPVVSSSAGQMFVSVKSNTSWVLGLQDDVTGKEVDWADLSVIFGSGNKNNIVLTYQANSSETESRKLRIVVDDGRGWAHCTVEQSASGQHPEPEPTPLPDLEFTNAGWLELPAMDDQELGYYNHSFEMSGKSYRNYSFAWSQDDLVAIWVAYPLCKFYTNGDAGRTNAWAYDPLLGELSPAPFGGYGEELARGHQLPSADRQCSREANAQTFYGTNMTPQLNAHNGGIWAELEGRVRNISNTSDTTYVVTGVILEGSKRTTYDSDGKSITVPSAYFKALLKYSKSSTLGQWNAAAFYLEHRDYTESLGKQHSMSVDELEEITGIDFFVNLPSVVGSEQAAILEAADPADSSVWW